MAAPPSEKRSVYEVVGVSRDCTADEIRSAYKSLELQRHPHELVRSGGPESEASVSFQELVSAYEVLSALSRVARLAPKPLRLENLDLMSKHGPEVWKLYNQQLEAFLSRLKSQVMELNGKIESVNRERKYHQATPLNQKADQIHFRRNKAKQGKQKECEASLS